MNPFFIVERSKQALSDSAPLLIDASSTRSTVGLFLALKVNEKEGVTGKDQTKDDENTKEDGFPVVASSKQPFSSYSQLNEKIDSTTKK